MSTYFTFYLLISFSVNPPILSPVDLFHFLPVNLLLCLSAHLLTCRPISLLAYQFLHALPFRHALRLSLPLPRRPACLSVCLSTRRSHTAITSCLASTRGLNSVTRLSRTGHSINQFPPSSCFPTTKPIPFIRNLTF